MKTKIIILFLAVLSLCSCSGRKQRESNSANNNDFPQEVNYIDNFVSDTIVGKFNGVDVDTLVSWPIDTIPETCDPDDIYAPWHYKWVVKSLNGTVKDLIIERTTRVALVPEGDLDGDGNEEFGYVTHWPTSNWMQYHLFTYKDGEWKTLIEPFPVWLCHIDSEDSISNPQRFTEKDIAHPTGKKGEIHIRFSDVRNDGEDFLFIDTIVKVNPQPVNWNY